MFQRSNIAQDNAEHKQPTRFASILSVILLASVSSCQSQVQSQDQPPEPMPINSPQPQVEQALVDAEPPTTAMSEVSTGTGEFFTASSNDAGTGERSADGSGEDFIFRNAPLDVVINQVLGETYGLSYSIGPNVSGNISLRLEGMASATQAVSALNAALNLQNFEITEAAETYFVRRIGSTGREQDGDVVFIGATDAIPSGASTAILSLTRANTEEVATLVSSIMPSALVKADDDDRGLIVISGTPDQVYRAAQMIRSLDIDYLSAVSTGMMELSSASADQITAEMSPIVERMGGVSLVPINRLNSVLIVARNEESLMMASDWITRLDRSSGPKMLDDLLIYKANHASAFDLVALAGGDGFDAASFSAFEDAVSSNTAPSGPPAGAPAPFPVARSGGLYSDLSIRVDEGQNAIIARGPSADLASLAELLKTLDQPKRQVLIEATIVEVTLSDNQSLGVEWNAIEDQIAATLSNTTSGTPASLFPGISVSYINTDVNAVVNALASTSDVEVVSAPRMMVLNNETARLQIGDQVPVVTQSAVSITDPGAPIVNSTTYRDTGVILTVTPRIRSGGMVEIQVSQEVSGVAEESTTNTDSPTITQRSVESVLAIPNGATAVLGGLMSSTRSQSRDGVPVLMQIPILGALFSSTSWTERRTELVVLIEPTVVQADQPLVSLPQRLRTALDRVRNQS
ncbi:MAG: secretin N-terminal domain-containing protein [Pseudomonadota bacterium]